MQFKLNTDSREQRVDELVDLALLKVEDHLANGRSEIELLIENEFAAEVKDKLTDLFEGQFDWLIIRREPNQYTGRMQHFTSERIGDHRRYKIRYITKQ